jgi:hypothetical protein
MECLMSSLTPDLAQNLHETNSRLGFWLDSLIPDSEPSRAVTPQQMSGILSELMHAGQWLRTLPPDRNPALEQELDKYRKNVERLRGLLPSIQGALLRERARLEQERGRVAMASEWARRSRQTL